MKRVTGMGGIFFKTRDPKKMRDWYEKHLGIASGEYGSHFTWRDETEPTKKCTTAWNLFKADSDYFQPSKKEFMFNYRVDDLEALFEAFRKEGVEIVGEIESYEYGKFGWIMDPDGNKIELWEPVDEFLGLE
jgi:predicted enzyme related to lactoylglutathione lyase